MNASSHLVEELTVPGTGQAVGGTDGNLSGAAIPHGSTSDVAESIERLRAILNSSLDCVKLLDLDGNILWMNAASRHAMQLEDSQDITGQAWIGFWKNEHRLNADAAVASAVAGNIGSFTAFCATAMGAPRWWDVTVTALLDSDGQPEQLLVVSRDVGRRERIDERRPPGQGMDNARDAAAVAGWEWRVASGHIDSSAALLAILGLQSLAVADRQPSPLRVHPDDVAGARTAIERAAIDHEPFEIELRLIHPDGGIRTLAVGGRALLDSQGQAERIVGGCHDISERKRGEQMDAGLRDILTGIASQRPLGESLECIARLHEQLNPGSLCSLLLLDATGERLLHGAGPSLPVAYTQALDGVRIGDRVGSCGTAAWRAERVLVADIANHPYWINYRDLALAHGLLACWSTPILGSDGQVLATFAVYYREIREPGPEELAYVDRMLAIATVAIESARQTERLLERDRFFEMSQEIFCTYDPRVQRFSQVNPRFTQITGFSSEEMTSRHFLEFVHPDDRDATLPVASKLATKGETLTAFANRYLCRSGGFRWLQWEATAAPDGLVYGVAHDITERRRVEAELDYAASHDIVTSLPHHIALERALASQLEDSAQPMYVFFIGLDRFQAVNESMGHVIGDEILQQVAGRLQQVLGGAGELARFAGDEFIVAATGLDQASALVLADRLREAVALPFETGEYRLLLTASVGISHSPDHGTTAQELLRRAEAAMTQAKRHGRDCIHEYSVEQMQEIEDRLVLGRHLRLAIQCGELQLHYQPQYASIGHALAGFEALLRWNSHTLGPVAPVRFIPVAEALGLMPEIGAWVVDEACRQGRAWLDSGHRDFNIAINVAAAQLQRPGLVGQIREALERHAVPPALLSIELTESSLMENVERVRDTLFELKSLGVKLALDDFGTGYSSLAYLKQFPIDKLKIDQSFVRGLPQDSDDAIIARTIVAMAHQLRMVVSAEGVETQAQATFLKTIGCDELQGYLLGRPVPAGEAETFFRR